MDSSLEARLAYRKIKQQLESNAFAFNGNKVKCNSDDRLIIKTTNETVIRRTTKQFILKEKINACRFDRNLQSVFNQEDRGLTETVVKYDGKESRDFVSDRSRTADPFGKEGRIERKALQLGEPSQRMLFQQDQSSTMQHQRKDEIKEESFSDFKDFQSFIKDLSSKQNHKQKTDTAVATEHEGTYFSIIIIISAYTIAFWSFEIASVLRDIDVIPTIPNCFKSELKKA